MANSGKRGIYETCYGNLTQTDKEEQDSYHLHRNDVSQSQNESSHQKEGHNHPNQVIFGTRLRPRTRIYYSYPIAVDKNHNPDVQKLYSSVDANSQSERPFENYADQLNHMVEDSIKTNDNASLSVRDNSSQNKQRSLPEDSKNLFKINDNHNDESRRLVREYFENKNDHNRTSNNASAIIPSNIKPRSLISFRSSKTQNGQYIKPFVIEHGRKKIQNLFKTSYSQTITENSIGSQNSFSSNCNVSSNILFFRKSGSRPVNVTCQNTFKASDYLPPTDKTTSTAVYKAEEYLPPKKPGISLLPPRDNNHTCYRCNGSTTTRRPYYTINTITNRPLNTTTTTKTIHTTISTKMPYYIQLENQIPTTKRPHCHTCGSTGPFYIPAKAPTTTAPNVSQINNNDIKKGEDDPARARKVPQEFDEDVVPSVSNNDRFEDAMGNPRVDVELKDTPKDIMTLTTSRPVDGVNIRGDISDYDNLTTITPAPRPAPGNTIPVPTEPVEESTPTTTMSTSRTSINSPSTMTMTATDKTTITTEVTKDMPSKSTSSVTLNMAQSTTTTENHRHLIDEESRPTISMKTTSTTKPTPFRGSEYLPPKNNTTGAAAGPAAMAMPVPPEPGELILIPTSPPTTVRTTITTPTTTLTTTLTTPSMTSDTGITMTMPEIDRHLIEEESKSTTPINTMQTTTHFKGPEYLPPNDTSATVKMPNVNITSSNAGPALAMPVLEERDEPLSPTLKHTTPTHTFRFAETFPKSPAFPDTEPFKAPEYLPPKETGPAYPPLPAMATPVTSEPECDDDSPYPDIEQRSFTDDPCKPNAPPTKPDLTSKPPFKGPIYLPPSSKTRVGRSSNMTLGLRDLEGTPRPVWYAGVYKKITSPYYPICGGSIIREDVVISAAHCFWDDSVGRLPASLFAVAARKIHKRYNDPMDKRAQTSDVLDIKIPPRFLGAKTSFQEDIAILKLTTPFKFTQSIRGLRPICVDFDDEFDRQQMKGGHQGTFAGWGLTDASGSATKVLLWLELPYVEIENCIRDSEESFLKYITCDKVCAGENDTGKALCRGDSGGGLVFWQGAPSHATPYLRGVASTAPAARAACNVFAYASFTHVFAHRAFLRQHVPGIEECRFWE